MNWPLVSLCGPMSLSEIEPPAGAIGVKASSGISRRAVSSVSVKSDDTFIRSRLTLKNSFRVLMRPSMRITPGMLGMPSTGEATSNGMMIDGLRRTVAGVAAIAARNEDRAFGGRHALASAGAADRDRRPLCDDLLLVPHDRHGHLHFAAVDDERDDEARDVVVVGSCEVDDAFGDELLDFRRRQPGRGHARLHDLGQRDLRDLQVVDLDGAAVGIGRDSDSMFSAFGLSGTRRPNRASPIGTV